MLQIGTLIDNRYKIISQIGRGGTSSVYLAENVRLHNRWAIKEVYKTEITMEGVKNNGLIAESSILTKLRHPGLPTIVDIIETQHAYLIIMEYIDGVSLDKVLLQQGACEQQDVIKWGKQLCDVLTFLHNQTPSIIYRDMKPANIMLKPDGNIVLIDFGMAREFKTQRMHDTHQLGTHGYAAPEQYDGTKQSDARTDIYSLGVTLYHLVTGHDPCMPPYGINDIRSMNPDLSLRFNQIIQKCTKNRPEDRYQTTNELKQDLSLVGNSEIVEVEFGSKKKKNPSLALIFALVPTLLLIVIVCVAIVGINEVKVDKRMDFLGKITELILSNVENKDNFFKQEVHVLESGKSQLYYFTPEQSGYYNIYSVSNEAKPVVWLLDKQKNILDSDNTEGDKDDFSLSYYLMQGESYCVETTLYNLDPETVSVGSYWIYVEYDTTAN